MGDGRDRHPHLPGPDVHSLAHVPPLAFLFWGWFRALITYALYSVIAGVLLRVWGGIAAGYITTLSNTDFSFSSLGWLALWYISVIPLLVASILSALKVGELASTIVGGGGGGGSGALGLVGSAVAVKGGGRLAAECGEDRRRRSLIP